MIYALIASIIVALFSMVGILVFRNARHTGKTHRFILPFAVGVFLGIVFLELTPETLALSPYGAFAILAGFFGFYLISHLLRTYHHHHVDDHDHCGENGAKMLLIGDAVHNISDGVVITSAFLINPILGVVTTIGVIMHEIPQEIAEFGVLIHSGCSKQKALTLNLVSASSILIGVIITSLFANFAGEYLWVVIGIAAGNLLYIATSDFIPELRESHNDHFKQTFLTALAGVIFIAVMLTVSHEFTEKYEATHEIGVATEHN